METREAGAIQRQAPSARPIDWPLVRLDEIVEARRDPVAPAESEIYREIGIRSHGKGIFHKPECTANDIGDKRVFRVAPGCLVFNIVFAWEGAVAVTTELERGMIASHRFPMFTPAPTKADVDFLRRFFISDLGIRRLADASPGGAGRNRTLNQRDLGAIEVALPPLGEQRKIAAILSSIDDTIEKTEAVIAQLEIVKKAMMQELLTRGMPGRHTRFKQTDIGEIPEEWDVVELGALIVGGPDNGVYRHADDYGDGVPIVRINAFDAGELLRTAGLQRVRLEEADVRRFGLAPGDILINRVNSMSHIAKAALVDSLPETTVFESNMMRITLNPQRTRPRFSHLWISSEFSRAYFRTRAKQAVAQASVNQGDVRSLPVPLPRLDEQDEIVRGLEALDRRLAADRGTLGSLRDLKSALGGALLSGELRVTPDEASP